MMNGRMCEAILEGIGGGYVNRAGVSPSLVILYLIMYQRQSLFFVRLESEFSMFSNLLLVRFG